MLSTRRHAPPVHLSQHKLYSLLQQCKQIAKSDRLHLRSLIKNNHPVLLSLLMKYKRNHSKTIADLSELQVSLRKFVAEEKKERERIQVESYRRQKGFWKIMTMRSVKSIEDGEEEGDRRLQNRMSKSLDGSRRRGSSTISKFNRSSEKERDCKILVNELSSIERENIEKLLGRNEPSSQFLSKTLFASQSSRNLPDGKRSAELVQITEPPLLFHKQQPRNKKKTEVYFTDPKILQQCRSIIMNSRNWSAADVSKSPVKTPDPIPQKSSSCEFNGYSIVHTQKSSTPNVLLLSSAPPFCPDTIFSGLHAQPIIEEIFYPEEEISKQSFTYRLQQFISRNYPTYKVYRQSLQAYFHILSDNGQTINICRLGAVLDEFCTEQYSNQVRKLWKDINKGNFPCLGRDAITNSLWEQLFDKAEKVKKGYIGYWELYSARKSWQFAKFSIWYWSKRFGQAL